MTTIYNSAKRRIFSGDIDVDADTLRVALISDDIAYTPDPDAQEFVADVLDGVDAVEFTGTGYSRQTVTTPTVGQDNVNDRAEFDGDDVVFTGIDGDTVQSALLYKEVGVDATTPADDPVIAHITSANFPMPANGGDITVQWDPEGILHLG